MPKVSSSASWFALSLSLSLCRSLSLYSPPSNALAFSIGSGIQARQVRVASKQDNYKEHASNELIVMKPDSRTNVEAARVHCNRQNQTAQNSMSFMMSSMFWPSSSIFSSGMFMNTPNVTARITCIVIAFPAKSP